MIQRPDQHGRFAAQLAGKVEGIGLLAFGRQALPEARARMGLVVDRALAGLGGDDTGRLMALLQLIVANLDEGQHRADDDAAG